ncbi:hypothetical protein [Endozoicomonas sp. ISHI1]|uniref:hypothetical protein n=3 Tax=unclassified Endozoicomonas TaxID=2644528 RepID=UPI00214853A8|nr:hypothetical protein [Endozoicomonas sp. ISHI1]
MADRYLTMKKENRFNILILFLLLSSYSNSDVLHFEWKLEHHSYLLLRGTTETSSQTSHSNALAGFNDHSSELDGSTQLFTVCSGHDFAIYDVASSTHLVFDQNNPGYIVPKLFRTLLGNGIQPIQHRLHTQYILRGQTATTAGNIAELLCCIFCNPFYMGFKMYSSNISHGSENELARIRALEAAMPNHLPEHVTVHKRSLSHKAMSSDNQIISTSSTETVDGNTHIFDLFLNTPETHQWIAEHLNPTTNLKLELIIPELFDMALPAEILVQEQNDTNNRESLQPSHFVSFNLDNGVRVQYHIYQVSTHNIQVLAILVSTHGYTLTLSVDDYNVEANQPPPHYAELPENYRCNGACNCAASRIISDEH